MERLKDASLFLLLGACAAGLVLFPAESAEAAREGLRLSLETVLPSLFPFFVLSSLAISSGVADQLAHALERFMRPLFSISGAGAGALILGLVGGYPVGARTTAELYRGGSLAKSEAERLLAFCNNAGPGFLLGICGGAVFQSARAGLYLYLVHVAAALLTGVALRRAGIAGAPASEPRRAKTARRRFAAAFPAAVKDSFLAVWSVCGFVVLFAVLLRFLTLLAPMGVDEGRAYPLLLGLVELTNGVMALPNGRGGFVLCAALLAWGGLCVHAQTLSVLEDSGLSTKYYFAGKLLQAAFSVPLALLAAQRAF